MTIIKLDLAVANWGPDNTVSVFLATDYGTFQYQQTYSTDGQPESITTGDFNNDKILDLAVANSDISNVSVLLGNGNGTFRNSTTYSTGNNPVSIVTNDFNNDMRLDLAVVNGDDGSISVFVR